jgi:Predicted metal binding domain
LDREVFVDPCVSREKFDCEVNEWRKRAAEHGRRGIVLIEADFPKVFAVFALPTVRPAHLLFGAELDFTNYDIWPPSLTFADPLTREPWPNGMNSPVNIVAGAAMIPLFIRFRPNTADPNQFTMEVPVICQGNTGRAFLCMRGVREYHEHPAHSGDSWLQYRGTGIGTLFYILDKLHEFGISHLAGMRIGLHYLSAGRPQIVPAENPDGQHAPTGDHP